METLKKNSLFWDVEAVDPDRHAQFVMERILTWGDVDDLSWALEYYGYDRLRQAFLVARQMDKKSTNFWCYYFKLNQEECTTKLSTHPPSAYWQR